MRLRTVLGVIAVVGLTACGSSAADTTTTTAESDVAADIADPVGLSAELDCGTDANIIDFIGDGFPPKGAVVNTRTDALRKHVAEAAPSLAGKVSNNSESRRQNDNGFSFPDQPPPQAQEHNVAQYRAGGKLKAYFTFTQSGNAFLVNQSEMCGSFAPNNGPSIPNPPPTVPIEGGPEVTGP